MKDTSKPIDERRLKIRFKKEKVDESLPLYPWCFLPYAPPQDCVFDSYRGVVGFDIFPFAVTTRIDASQEVFVKVYEKEDTDKY